MWAPRAAPGANIYFGGSGYGRRQPMPAFAGNGHEADPHYTHPRLNDERLQFFHYCFNRENQHGFAHHIAPVEALSSDESRAVELIGLQPHAECPCFDFKPCYWCAAPSAKPGEDDYRKRDEQYHSVHARYHQQQPGRVAKAVDELLECRREMLAFGWDLFDALQSSVEAAPLERSNRRWKYDLAISFAGAQRPDAEEIARYIEAEGFTVFYDKDRAGEMWGEHLPAHLYRVYSEDAGLCLMLISREYLEREWTAWELRASIDRLVSQRGQTYILPLRCDDAPVPEMLRSISYESLQQRSLPEVKELLIKRLRTLALGETGAGTY